MVSHYTNFQTCRSVPKEKHDPIEKEEIDLAVPGRIIPGERVKI